jgi:hypothetical protein
MNSTPTLQQFDPKRIPYQIQVLRDIRKNFDYKKHSFHEVLLSGSVGSAKSILIAHVAVTHCLFHKGARFCLARRSMPDLKRTIFQTVVDHIADLDQSMYEVNETKASIRFNNGSEIISTSWADKKAKKARSLQLSGIGFEEVTENDDKDKKAYDELRLRVNRLPHVPEQIIIAATNPDSPSHWAYKHWVVSKETNRHVYYSVTTDNPFLPATYIEQLKSDLDPKMAERMLYGKWIEIEDEVIYYAYSRDRNYRDYDYKVNEHLPIYFTYDFNIGAGKPMSCCFFQIIGDTFHFFDEVVIDGARTENTLEEAASRGLFDLSNTYYCNGDAAGKHRDTRSNQSDYDIIDSFLKRHRKPDGTFLQYARQIPSANPPIRDRHNIVNAYCLNLNKEVRLFVYKKAATLDEGMRLTKLRPGSQYIEDDSKRYQHITTALGYAVHYHNSNLRRDSAVKMLKR